MSEITRYDPIEGVLAQLRDKYQGVQFDVQTKDGLAAAKEAKRSLVKLRTGLEGLRKDEKAEHLERGRKIDGEAKRIEGEIRSLEEPIAHQIDAEERRLEELKQAQAKRDAVARQRLADIEREPTFYSPGMASERMLERFGRFSEPVESDFAGSCIAHADAVLLYNTTCAAIHSIIAEAKQAEAKERERQAAEEALAAKQRELEAQQAALQRQADEIAAQQRAMDEAKAREERAHQQALDESQKRLSLDDAVKATDSAPQVMGFDLASAPDETVIVDVDKDGNRCAPMALRAGEPVGFDEVKVPPQRIERANRVAQMAGARQQAAGFFGDEDADPFGNQPKTGREVMAKLDNATQPDRGQVLIAALREIHDLTATLKSPLGRQVATIAAKALGLN